MKERKKLYQKLVSKVTLHFVWGHPSRKQTVIWDHSRIFHTYLRCSLECFSLARSYEKYKKISKATHHFLPQLKRLSLLFPLLDVSITSLLEL